MKPVKVLVVDDSALIRMVVRKALESDKSIVVVGEAEDGSEVLEKIRQLKPDVVTMDVEMPKVDGLAALRRVMKEFPVPVVMLSTLTTLGARTTVQALAEGAVDFVPKPSRAGQFEEVAAILKTKIKLAALASRSNAWRKKWERLPDAKKDTDFRTSARTRVDSFTTEAKAEWAVETSQVAAAKRVAEDDGAAEFCKAADVSRGAVAGRAAEVHQTAEASQDAVAGRVVGAGQADGDGRVAGAGRVAREVLKKLKQRPGVIVIGSSTGGPAALHRIIPALPGDLVAPVVIVQHFPVGFSQSLAEHLDVKSRLEVRHAQNGDEVRRGRVLVAPVGWHFRFKADEPALGYLKRNTYKSTRQTALNELKERNSVYLEKSAGQERKLRFELGREKQFPVELSLERKMRVGLGQERKVRVELSKGSQTLGTFCPSVDEVMMSAAKVYGGSALAVLLTGMGRDGTRGMTAVKRAGGVTIAEAESSCVIYGMPKSAVEAGVVDYVLPLEQIIAEMASLSQSFNPA